jgi:hypothetical protein
MWLEFGVDAIKQPVHLIKTLAANQKSPELNEFGGLS